MPVKRRPERFTLEFNPRDPQQSQVIALLNTMGRRKAVFLTSAVLCYIGQEELPMAPAPSHGVPETVGPRQRFRQEELSTELTTPESLQADDLQAIGAALDLFRK